MHIFLSLVLYAATYIAIIWSLVTNFKMGLVAALIFFMNIGIFNISPYWEKVE